MKTKMAVTALLTGAALMTCAGTATAQPEPPNIAAPDTVIISTDYDFVYDEDDDDNGRDDYNEHVLDYGE